MAKASSQFVCQSCGAVSSKWSGRCDNCGEWNTISEEAAPTPLSGAKGASLPKGRVSRLVGLKVIALKRVRIGHVTLGALPVGKWRFLAANERF